MVVWPSYFNLRGHLGQILNSVFLFAVHIALALNSLFLLLKGTYLYWIGFGPFLAKTAKKLCSLFFMIFDLFLRECASWINLVNISVVTGQSSRLCERQVAESTQERSAGNMVPIVHDKAWAFRETQIAARFIIHVAELANENCPSLTNFWHENVELLVGAWGEGFKARVRKTLRYIEPTVGRWLNHVLLLLRFDFLLKL